MTIFGYPWRDVAGAAGSALIATAVVTWVIGHRGKLAGLLRFAKTTAVPPEDDRLDFALKLHSLTETARGLGDQEMVSLLNQVHDRWTLVRPAEVKPAHA